MNDKKHTYINMTDASIWGGNNGEINIGLDSGDTLTFTAFDLLRDLPVLKKLCQEEIAKELDKILDDLENRNVF